MASSEYRLPVRDSRPLFDDAAHRVACAVTGVWHIGDWINEEEEAALTECIDRSHTYQWTKLLDRRLLHLGGSPTDSLGKGIDIEPLPAWMQAVCHEFVRCQVFPATAPPNHVLLNEYKPGQGIDAHKDGPLYAPLVAVLSLGSHATFQFVTNTPERAPVASLLIPRRGLLIFSGDDAYTRHLHTVKAQLEDDPALPGLVRLEDGLAGERETGDVGDGEPRLLLRRGRRLSLTVRRVRRPDR